MAYIDVEKKIKYLQEKCISCIDYERCTSCHIDEMINELKNTPTAKVKEEKHGEWVQKNIMFTPYCSNCKTYNVIKTNYCPNCGADMRPPEK